MNFYYEASRVLDDLEAKQGSIKGLLARVSAVNRKRMTAAVIETLKCEMKHCLTQSCLTNHCPSDKPTLLEIINASSIMKLEKKHIPKLNLCLLLVHDLLFARGIQAG